MSASSMCSPAVEYLLKNDGSLLFRVPTRTARTGRQTGTRRNAAPLDNLRQLTLSESSLSSDFSRSRARSSSGFAVSKAAHGVRVCMYVNCDYSWIVPPAQSRTLLFSFFSLFFSFPPNRPHPHPPSPPLHLSMTGQTRALRITTLSKASLIITQQSKRL